mmetsp:Transcript_43547/g.85911  ORF Transcript_43547/g.85911 Transcript_43547/m.85911 type:complete len:96 (+) Transcript_43547:396-683(+)
MSVLGVEEPGAVCVDEDEIGKRLRGHGRPEGRGVEVLSESPRITTQTEGRDRATLSLSPSLLSLSLPPTPPPEPAADAFMPRIPSDSDPVIRRKY